MKVCKSYQKHSKNGISDVGQLLEQLPVLQQLLYRLVCCQPERAARDNYLVQYALAMIVKESFKVYCRINDGMIVLVDTYFDMPKEEAVSALAIYKKAGRQADHLADFYDLCRTLDLARSFKFPILRQPPSSFVATMEEYIKKAPERVSLSCQMKVEHERIGEETGEEKAVCEAMQAQQPVDLLLDLSEASPKPDALALAICEPDQPQTSPGSGWELALVGSTSLRGGFDRLLLDSLYDDAAARQQLELHRAGYTTDGYGHETTPQNLFLQHDPFACVAMMSPRQQQQQQHQMMMAPMNPNPYACQYPEMQQIRVSMNPFHSSMPLPPHGSPTLL